VPNFEQVSHDNPLGSVADRYRMGALASAVARGKALSAGISNHSRARTLAELALTWVLRHPVVTSADIGASMLDQREHNVAAVHSVPATGITNWVKNCTFTNISWEFQHL
jgi:aryl-alcohol dehydrogenase-like predicted oxidoreductase